MTHWRKGGRGGVCGRFLQGLFRLKLHGFCCCGLEELRYAMMSVGDDIARASWRACRLAVESSNTGWGMSRTCKVRGRIDHQVNSWNSHCFGLAAHLSASNFSGAAYGGSGSALSLRHDSKP